jgi:pyrimidine-nucleoside phosphorylase
VGDHVEKGESLATIHSNREDIEDIKKKIYSNINITNEIIETLSLIKGIITE